MRAAALDPAPSSVVEHVARLHDLGKIGIPDAILQKPGALDERELTIMREHPEIGARIVASVDGLAHLAPLIPAEHERWDGGGYPRGLAGEQIPLASRIVFACDAYRAMASDRSYRRAMAPDRARAELMRHSASQFDPQVVTTLLAVLAVLAARGGAVRAQSSRGSATAPRSAPPCPSSGPGNAWLGDPASRGTSPASRWPPTAVGAGVQRCWAPCGRPPR